MRLVAIALLLGLCLLAPHPVNAAVRLAGLFSDGVVLQRDKQVAIWGQATPGESLVIKFRDQQVSAVADKAGNWRALLNPMSAGGPYELDIKGTTSTGVDEVTVHNVLVGEVWLCAGQSNMGLSVSYCAHEPEDLSKSLNPNLRFFSVPENLSSKPLTVIDAHWSEANPKIVVDLPAVAYYFGRELQTSLNVPVGVIIASMGGASINSWLSREALATVYEDCPDTAAQTDFAPLKELFEKRLEVWRRQVQEARAKGLPEPAQPSLTSEVVNVSATHAFTSSIVFNALIHPVIPFAIKGVTWYQGEADVGIGSKYTRLFAAMINDWRKRWNDPSLPFLFVQLPGFGERDSKATESYWAEIREAQCLSRRIPYAYMAVTIDTAKGEKVSIHPREKKEIAQRLATIALSTQYKQAKPFYGPLYDSIEFRGNKARVNFRYAAPGLLAKDGPPRGFEIAGSDRHFVPAQATIVAGSVIVWNDKIAEPVAVRYGWADNPDINLYNRAALPASPFRTDHWPIPRPQAKRLASP